jgi:hypothetical protein
VTTTQTQFKEAGVTLKVTPRVANDASIEMQLTPSFSRLTGYSPPPSPQPIFDKREADTTVRVANQQVFAIGGLRQRNEITNDRGLPGLKDIKRFHFHRLWSNESRDFRESELIVFVSPEIVTPHYGGRPREQMTGQAGMAVLDEVPPFGGDQAGGYCPEGQPGYGPSGYAPAAPGATESQDALPEPVTKAIKYSPNPRAVAKMPAASPKKTATPAATNKSGMVAKSTAPAPAATKSSPRPAASNVAHVAPPVTGYDALPVSFAAPPMPATPPTAGLPKSGVTTSPLPPSTGSATKPTTKPKSSTAAASTATKSTSTIKPEPPTPASWWGWNAPAPTKPAPPALVPSGPDRSFQR